jgi:hypothetical protein
MRFQVLNGHHTVGKKVYSKGEVVESDRPLDKQFLNKFRNLDKAPDSAPRLVDTAPEAPTQSPKPSIKRVARAAAPVPPVEAVAEPEPADVTPAAPESAPAAPVTTTSKRAARHNGGGRWNVFDEAGTKLNEKYLSRDEAKALVAQG